MLCAMLVVVSEWLDAKNVRVYEWWSFDAGDKDLYTTVVSKIL